MYARFGLFVAALMAATMIAIPTAAQAAPHDAAPSSSSGLSFTPVSPTRLYDSRTTGKQIPAHGTAGIRVQAPLVPADTVAVVVNLTGTNPAGTTYLDIGQSDSFGGDSTTSNLNLMPGETRANLATVTIGAHRQLALSTGPNAVDAIVDLVGYYASSAAARYTPLSPDRVLDTRSGAPVGPNGTVTLDLSDRVPVGTTAVTFNLTATDVTQQTFVTAYPADQGRPDTSTLNPTPGADTPNLVTVAVSADRKVSLTNSVGSVDLIADLAGYYSPQSTQAYYPEVPLRVLDTRDAQLAPREPIVANGEHRIDLSGWLPAGATAALFNLTATNVAAATYLTAHPDGVTRSSASTLNVVAGQTAANLAIVAVSPDRAVTVYNHSGQVDVLVDLSGYFAPALPACTARCLYAFGDDQYGGMGDGRTNYPEIQYTSPATAVYGLTDVVAASSFGAATYALRSDGTVWSWGRGSDGSLGNGPIPHGENPGAMFPPAVYSTLPTRVSGLTDVVAIADGFALRSDGTVWSWGPNTYQRLGQGWHGDNYISDEPARIDGLSDVIAIAGSGFALKRDGTVWSWGPNQQGQLGTGTAPAPDGCDTPSGLGDEGPNCASAVPVQVLGLHDVTAIGDRLAVKSDGTVWQWGPRDYHPRQDNAPVQVPGLANAVAVAAGLSNYALLADGTVRAWGDNRTGTLGNGTKQSEYVDTPVAVSGLTGVKAIAGGFVAGYAVLADGTEYAWGGGSYGALGDGQYFGSSLTPVRIATVSGADALGTNGFAITG